jgi:SAM-dependent methyltransferase
MHVAASSPSDVSPFVSERERVLGVYAARQEGDYGYASAWALRLRHQRQALLARQLSRIGITSLSRVKVLDFGCGEGQFLRLLNHWGARPDCLYGCDVNAQRIATAREMHPSCSWTVTDGGRLPYESGEFDLVCQSTVFTSILSSEVRSALAEEMRRVTRPGGAILWFDFRYDNPRNQDVKGVGGKEIRRLFPGRQVELASIGLLPPLSRRISAFCPPLASLLELAPPLRYAYQGVIRL